MVQDIEDITADHNPAPIYTITKATALEETPHALLSATTAAYATLYRRNGLVIPHAMISTGIVTPHQTLNISPTGATHTTPWTRASLSPAAQDS